MKKRLNSHQIKLIAIAAMTIDHLTWTLFPGTQTVWYVYCLHIIGRLTAPIMWFFIKISTAYTPCFSYGDTAVFSLPHCVKRVFVI